MNNSLLNDYITKLGSNRLKIVGVWKQGSTVYDYADKFSDEDYIVVWDKKYPTKEIRMKTCSNAGFGPTDFADKPYKGLEQFKSGNTLYNIAHLPEQYGFFELYENIQRKETNEAQLYRLGGFKRGEIIYDPENILQNYRDTVVVTNEIVNNYKKPRERSTRKNLENLEVAAARKHPLGYIKCLNCLLITLHTIHYLENDQFPLPIKWFEKEIAKFSWETSLTKIILDLKETLPFNEVAENLTEYLNQKQP